MGLLPWIVMWMIDEDGAGIWGACLTLANISNMFVFGANYFFLPHTVQALKTRGVVGMGRVLWQAAIVFTVVLSALCVFYLFCGGFVLKSAFGERFEPYAVLTAVIGLSFLVVSYSTVAGNGMTALGRPEGLFWGELAFGIVCVVGGAFLSKTMGLNGTALGLCLASLTATIVESAYLKGVAASARYTAK
jgi:O-antigen/teichoic acid export membrane protein